MPAEAMATAVGVAAEAGGGGEGGGRGGRGGGGREWRRRRERWRRWERRERWRWWERRWRRKHEPRRIRPHGIGANRRCCRGRRQTDNRRNEGRDQCAHLDLSTEIALSGYGLLKALAKPAACAGRRGGSRRGGDTPARAAYRAGGAP